MSDERKCEHCGHDWLQKPKTVEPYLYKCPKCSRTQGENPDFKYPDEMFETPMVDRIAFEKEMRTLYTETEQALAEVRRDHEAQMFLKMRPVFE